MTPAFLEDLVKSIDRLDSTLQATSTDWAQVVANTVGVLVAAAIALVVVFLQHRRAANHATSVEVANFLSNIKVVRDHCEVMATMQVSYDASFQTGGWSGASFNAMKKIHEGTAAAMTVADRIILISRPEISVIADQMQDTVASTMRNSLLAWNWALETNEQNGPFPLEMISTLSAHVISLDEQTSKLMDTTLMYNSYQTVRKAARTRLKAVSAKASMGS